MQSFSKNQLLELKKILEKEGFKQNDEENNIFLYSITKEPEYTAIISAKIPIKIPIEFIVPINLVTFQISITIRPRWLDQNFEISIRKLAIGFRDTVNTLLKEDSYNYEFNFEPFMKDITTIVSKEFSSPNVTYNNSLLKEKEHYLQIRQNILNNKQTFDENNLLLSKDVLDIYHDFHLQPSNDFPPELSEGIPYDKRNLVVLFRRSEPDAYLLEEPGCISYARDYTFNNVWIRTSLESYSLNLWYQAFKNQNFKCNYLIYDWIVYCRGLIKKIFPILEDENIIKSQDLKSFSYIQFLQKYAPELNLPSLFLPQLAYEAKKTKNLGHRDNFLFESIPCSLEETSTVDDYIFAKLLVKKGNFKRAEIILGNVLFRLKKFHHILGQVTVLFRLNHIAYESKNFELSITYLKEALELAQSGKIPISDIIRIHIGLINSYTMNSNSLKIHEHQQILNSFLKSLPQDEEIDKLFIKYFIEMAKLHMKTNDLVKANTYFKEFLKKKENYSEFDAIYYYERSKYYRLKQNEAKQFQSLQKAITYKNNDDDDVNPKVLFEISKMYLYNKKEAEKSRKYLLEAIDKLNNTDIEHLKLKSKCIEVLIDSYRALNLISEAESEEKNLSSIREKLDHLY